MNRTSFGGWCPVIDLFAGPGGLGEGFSALRSPSGNRRFKIAVSVEKDRWAHQTLELRSFFRQFSSGHLPTEYYDHLAGKFSRHALFDRYPRQSSRARMESLLAEIGPASRDAINDRVRDQLDGQPECVLIGGPPCQAYSLAGRSRNKGVAGYRAEDDHRQYLYKEYLRIIARHWPMVFVMENVPGLISATLQDGAVFQRVLDDLRAPAKALRGRLPNTRAHWYDVVTLRPPSPSHWKGQEFIVRAEEHGIPQARHRVILIGIRDDLGISSLPPECQLRLSEGVSVRAAIADLPKLRSRLSRGADGLEAWLRVFSAAGSRFVSQARRAAGPAVADAIAEAIAGMAVPEANTGAEFLPTAESPSCWHNDWFGDKKLRGICNHSSRAHMPSDLLRYLFAAGFAACRQASPRLGDFPAELLPAHQNVELALNNHGYFQDRFRVQLWDRPSTTVTSHIARDGHAFIHPDPSQCRSLTVREAARLQTFPDNYYFCGPRTEQYKQVGNAVPPLLAFQVAECVWSLLAKAGAV